jgi:hypothetical protein
MPDRRALAPARVAGAPSVSGDAAALTRRILLTLLAGRPAPRLRLGTGREASSS